MTKMRRMILFLLVVLAVIVLGLALFLPAARKARHLDESSTATTPQPVSADVIVRRLDVARMQRHIQALAGKIGVRKTGTTDEAAGAEYIAGQFAASGYQVIRDEVPLPDGRMSGNVYVELPGKSTRIMLIGAHMDSKSPAPGANDNASGVAVMLELARVLHDTHPPYTCRFVAFGAEERIDRQWDHHHYGSRRMAADAALRARLHSMTALDMVGVGTTLHIENMGWATNRWRDTLAVTAKSLALPVRTGRGKPWSDHEAFERQGISTAYLHWERDPTYHTRKDRPANIQPERFRQTAEVMVRGIMGAAR